MSHGNSNWFWQFLECACCGWWTVFRAEAGLCICVAVNSERNRGADRIHAFAGGTASCLVLGMVFFQHQVKTLESLKIKIPF